MTKPFASLLSSRFALAVLLSGCPLWFCSCGNNEKPTSSVKSSALSQQNISTPGDVVPTAGPSSSIEAAKSESKPVSPVESSDPRSTEPEATKTSPPSKTEIAAADKLPIVDKRPTESASEEDERQRVVIERFVSVLEGNPRRGTALDKVYGHHVERGTLDGLMKKYQDAASETDESKTTQVGKSAMIVGLLESLRGQDAAAVKALEAAEKAMPENALASYYLGQALVLVGRTDQAVLAFERAIERKPAQADLIEIFHSLGRVHQRAQRNEKALDVWNRLEKVFPNDPRVQEQIATTLLEEGDHAAALPRFEALAKSTKDVYRQSLYRIEAAEIRVRLGQAEPAIADFEKLLGELNPENWLHREVRRKVEQVYLRTDDQAGLVSYYESWLQRNPEDIDAMTRLSRLLAGLGRGPESQRWLEQGLKSAPRRKELRLALIDQLAYEQKFSEAAAQYEALDKIEPNHPDVLRDWGRLLMRDTKQTEAQRKQAAAAVWHRLTAAKPKDALIASQVADLFRQAELTDEALKLYQTAIELAPDVPQYREYLGEYYHRLERRDEALATWRKIVEGKNRTPTNLSRLAEVLAGFGYLTEAIATNSEACELDKKDFSLWLKQSDFLHQAERFDEALAQLTIADSLTTNDEEREAVLAREIKNRQANGSLKTRIDELKKELETASTTK